ncbi:hypothetical protein N1851_022918 [Merluccius polli]|uniref:C2H2-type domain-containing protein n=1 Tax=Merluccius polli TaxID=89951 RepID=A0AA47MHI5_MERPO|nr:hypothetical protein N1851_022918 [Merluccius polli]
MCFIANSIEMNHVVYLSALEPVASRHFTDMERLRRIFTGSIVYLLLLPLLSGRLLTLVILNAQMAMCERQCHDTKYLIAHLREHIVEGRAVTCPVRGCTNVFTVKSSSTAHMSRKHRDLTDISISDLFRESASQSSSVQAETDNFGAQGEFLLPASTIQNIFEEIQNIHELGQTYSLSKLTALLKNDTSLSDEDITRVCESVRGSDLFSACHRGPMRTAYSRTQTFKKKFNYVEPKKMFLGRDDNRTDRFAYYVPVRETLKCLLESDLWQKSGEHSAESPTDVLSDISDGHQIFKSNAFFAHNPSCLKLVLYQDAFEVVNPLGSAKTIHKVLAVYASVANLPLHVRSNTDHMLLVLLCREKDFKAFGHAKVFSELLADLKELEENGIVLSDETVKGTLYYIGGDNLVSHCIGGFTENFSRSQYFCRYCCTVCPIGVCLRLSGPPGFYSASTALSLSAWLGPPPISRQGQSGDVRTRPLEMLCGKTGGVADTEGGETTPSAQGRNIPPLKMAATAY